MRASIMFSFIILGGFYNRNRNAYNSLAGSALLLLLFDPFLIYNVGFQLSYSAVFGLFFIYPKLKQMITIRNSISNKIWELMCISIAAQLSTSPLAIYYFHQFPNYFILTNLFVIPLAFSIVILGMLVLAISFFSLSTNFISQLLMLSLNILNKGVLQVSLLPYAVSDNLSLKRLELPMFYLILFSTIMLLLYKKRKWIFPLFTSVLIYLIFTISQYNSELKNNNWIVYNAKNWSVMDFISQRKSVLYGDSLFINSPDLQRYIIDENHIMNRIIQTTIIKNNYTKESAILEDLAFQGNLILFQSLRILYLDNEFRNNHYDKKLAIDFVVVSHNANIDLKTLKENYFFKMIILDSSNDWNTTNKLMQEAKKQGIDCWNVNEKGASNHGEEEEGTARRDCCLLPHFWRRRW